MANETVTYDLASVLNEIKADVRQIRDTQTAILVNQAELKGKIENLETRLGVVENEVKNIKGQNRGLIVAVVVFILNAVFRIFPLIPTP